MRISSRNISVSIVVFSIILTAFGMADPTRDSGANQSKVKVLTESSGPNHSKIIDYTVKRITDKSMAGRYVFVGAGTIFIHLRDDGSYIYYEDTASSIMHEKPSDKAKTKARGKWAVKKDRLTLTPAILKNTPAKLNNVAYFTWTSSANLTAGGVRGKMGAWMPHRKDGKGMTIGQFIDYTAFQKIMRKGFEIDKK